MATDDLTQRLSYEQAALYLDRIGLAEDAELMRENLAQNQYVYPLPQTRDFLNRMVMAHRQAVPCLPPDASSRAGQAGLATARLFEQVVVRRQGGDGFELNKSFNDLLMALGYSTRSCLAQVHLDSASPGALQGPGQGTGESPGPVPATRPHRVNLVDIEEAEFVNSYLADVGLIGPAPATALLLCSGSFIDPLGQRFRLSLGSSLPGIQADGQVWALWQAGGGGAEHTPLFTFDTVVLTEAGLAEHYAAQLPQSSQ